MKESYFIRHKAEAGRALYEHQRELFEKGQIAIHFGVPVSAPKSIDPADYETREGKSAIKSFVHLAKNGGYVWAEYRDIGKKILVGSVKAGSEIFYTTEENLATLTLENTREVNANEFESLRAGRPRAGTFYRWHVGKRLEDIVEKKETAPIWENVSTRQQESLCAEYLRYCNDLTIKLKYLLLPVGGNLEAVDINGVTVDGSYLYGEVTFRNDKQVIQKKIAALQNKMLNKDTKLVLFFPFGSDRSYLDKLKFNHSDINFVDTADVFQWLSGEKILIEKLFRQH